MIGNNNTYYKSSMYENKGENTAQEIIIALAIAIISLLLAGVIISHFSGSISSGNYYGSGSSTGNGGYSNNDGSNGSGYVGDGTDDTEEEDTEDYGDMTDSEDDYTDDTEVMDDSEEYSDDTEVDASYTDNSGMYISDCLTVDDYYQRSSSDGSFSFAYPKYVFNGSDINEEENYYDYYYEDDNGNRTMEMKIYNEDNPGDAVQNTKDLFYNMSATPSEVLYKVEPKDEVNDQGMGRGIVAGTYDYISDDTCVYIVVANDGEKNYIMEFYYPDSAPEYDYDDVNYIVDCVYRYCSFAGGTYKPRSHDLFIKDDMGEKK